MESENQNIFTDPIKYFICAILVHPCISSVDVIHVLISCIVFSSISSLSCLSMVDRISEGYVLLWHRLEIDIPEINVTSNLHIFKKKKI